MSGKPKWNNKEYALSKLSDFLEEHNTLIGLARCSKWQYILNQCRIYNHNIEELCAELGYDYLKLKGLHKPLCYYNDYDILKNTIAEFIDKYGYFPTIKEMKFNLDIPSTTIQKFGGIEKIKEDIGHTENELIDDSGFRNRSHYEYIVAQFLIHNKVSYKREQHPFPNPYDNLRSDFTFEKVDGTIYHLEVWGYKKSDVNGKRSQEYCKRKKEKIKLYEKYNINLISVENDLFSNTYDTIQEKLRMILSDVLDIDNLKNINHKYLINPYKMSDEELFSEIMKISNDSITLPKETDFTSDNKELFYEALKRFGNYNKFAKHFGVVTNRKRGYWNKDTALSRMKQIHNKYGYLPTSIEIRNNKLAKEDSLFIGFVDGVKSVFGNTIQGYLMFYENLKQNQLGDKDLEYLSNLYNLKYFRRDNVSEKDRERAYAILCA